VQEQVRRVIGGFGIQSLVFRVWGFEGSRVAPKKVGPQTRGSAPLGLKCAWDECFSKGVESPTLNTQLRRG